jgi:hypothetical protein
VNKASLVSGVVCLLLFNGVAFATSSTTYWTPATTDVQGFGILHVGVDNYFTVFRKAEDGGAAFATAAGPVTIGVLPFKNLQMEVGFDLMEPTDHPLLFNAKIGTPEGSLFKGSPALNLGIFNVGTEKNATDQNILFGLLGKTVPGVGRLHGGPYVGNSRSSGFVGGYGKAQARGVMIGFDRGFLPAPNGEFSRLVVAADYATGNNSIGGGGFGVYYYFTKSVSILTGPVWFNDESINGKWKWTVQLDINTDVLKRLMRTAD